MRPERAPRCPVSARRRGFSSFNRSLRHLLNDVVVQQMVFRPRFHLLNDQNGRFVVQQIFRRSAGALGVSWRPGQCSGAIGGLFQIFGFLGVLPVSAAGRSVFAVSGRGLAGRGDLLVWLIAAKKAKAQVREMPLLETSAKCAFGRRLGGAAGGLCPDEAPRNRRFRTFKSLDIEKVQETAISEQQA